MCLQSANLARGLAVASLLCVVVNALDTDHVASDTASALGAVSQSTAGYIVLTRNKPAVAYQGGVAGLAAVESAEHGRINVHGANTQAYVQYIDTQSMQIAAKARIADRIQHRYSYTVTGFSTGPLDDSQLAALRNDPNVIQVTRDTQMYLRTFSTPQFLGLAGPGPNGTGGAWDGLGGAQGPARAGEGTTIGIIDSGWWPETNCFSDRQDLKAKLKFAYSPVTNELFNGTCAAVGAANIAMCNRKVVGCRYFTAGLGGDKRVKQFPEETLSCRDVFGHGSHVSSIAAGNYGPKQLFGVSSGMAPRARIAMYKIFWGRRGEGWEMDAIAAVEAAVKDGVDILSFSGGISNEGSFRRPIDMAFMGAAKAGIFVAGAAGNNGPRASTVDYQAPWCVSVAASTHSRDITAELRLRGDVTLKGQGSHPVRVSGRIVLAANVRMTDVKRPDANVCSKNTLNSLQAKGTIVVCDRDPMKSQLEQSVEVKRAGAIGMVLLNTHTTDAASAVIIFALPTIHLANQYRAAVRTFAANKTARGTLMPAKVEFTKLAPQMMIVSSRGPALAGGGAIIKPDITAPGVDIFAAWSPAADPQDPLAWRYLSGTSMSTPHVAGLAALLRQKYPTWSPMAIKSALMTTAYQTTRTGTPGLPFGTPFDYGAGHVDALKMFNPGLVFDSSFDDWRLFLCGAERSKKDDWCGPCDKESPPEACTPEHFNSPSIALPGALLGTTKTAIRTVTSVLASAARFQASVYLDGDAAIFVNVTCHPETFTLNPGESQKLEITLQILEGSTNGKDYFGAVIWTSDQGTVSRVPWVTSAVTGMLFPKTVQLSGNDTRINYTVTTGFSGSVELRPQGLAQAQVLKALLGPSDMAMLQANIPENTVLARFSVSQADMPSADYDVDITVSKTSAWYSSRTAGTSNEVIDIKSPTAGMAQITLYGANMPSLFEVPVYAWFVTQPASNNLTVSPVSPEVQAGQQVGVSLGYNSLEPGGKYLGFVEYVRDDKVLGRTIVSAP